VRTATADKGRVKITGRANPGMTPLALGLYTIFDCQYCMVYGIHKGGWVGGSYIAHESCNSIEIM